MTISSDLKRAGREYCCENETVTFFCQSVGVSNLFVSALPVFLHAFTSSSPVPDAVTFFNAPNVVLVLTTGMPNYTANALITTYQQETLNITCSSGVPGSEQMLPLVHECELYMHCKFVKSRNIFCWVKCYQALEAYFRGLIFVVCPAHFIIEAYNYLDFCGLIFD